MLASALIVLRETLEAALLIGIIAAATRGLAGRNFWLAVGLGAGIAGSMVTAGLIETIAELAGGVGQELFNASLLGVAVLMLGWHNIWMARHGRAMAVEVKAVGLEVRAGQRELSALALLIALAVLREGSETALFLFGLAGSEEAGRAGLLLGGGLGLMAGVALGWALYSGLARLSMRHVFAVTGGLILLIAAGMAGQLGRLLVQAGLVQPLALPLWDTSAFMPMDSAPGKLFHLVIGYEAQPSGIQVLFYGTTFMVILLGMVWSTLRCVRPTVSGNAVGKPCLESHACPPAR